MAYLSPALSRAVLRDLARHPWQSWLSAIGIALGVAVVVAVDVANHSARTAFRLSVERVSGHATHQIEAAGGGIPDSVYARLRIEHGLRPAAPVVEGQVRIGSRVFTLLGLDPFAALELRQGGTTPDLGVLPKLLTEPGAFVMGNRDAAALGLTEGERLEVEAAGRTRPALVAGILRGGDPALTEGLLLADIATAQELLGRIDRIDRIDLILDEKRAQKLAEHLPLGLRLARAERRTQALMQMTDGFHTNLTAMSLLAMLVGGFIIYNAMTFAVLRRRPLLGTLRTLGVTRGQLFALVLGEALVFALVGALLGVVAGIGVGWGLVQLVTRTIDDLYFALTVSGLFLSPRSLLLGAGLGVITTLAAALGPALEAAAAQPRDVLRRHRIEEHGGHLVPRLALAGGGLMLAGLALVPLSGRSTGLGFLSLFTVVVGFGLCVPGALKGFAHALIPPLARLAGAQGRLAARGLVASISRTGLAAAALSVAVSATVGVGIMIDSFRGSVAAWLESTLASDLYVSALSAASGLGDGNLPRGLAEAVAALPAVAEVSQGRSARVQARAGSVALLALEGSSRSRRGFRFLGETTVNLWPRFREGELILVSEPYAYRRGLKTGDGIALFTREGWRDFEIGGVFQDYGSDSGMLVLAGRTYARLWGDPEVSTLGVVAAAGANPRALLERVRALAAAYPEPIEVRDNRSIREGSLEVFDRTFAITRVLRLLAVGVAFVGVLSALLALQLERGREHAILRATGMTPLQLAGLILLQTGSLGLAAGLLALPLGWIMGDLLIHVVNVRSFGWTLDRVVPASALALGPVLSMTAALLAGLYPARRAARTDPAVALREE